MDLIKKYLEEQSKDTGWKPAQSSRKDKYGNPVKTANVARSLARQAMQSAVKDLKKGPEAGKRQVEEVEELDELSKSTLASYAKKATQDSRMSQRTAKDFERHELQSRKPEYKAGAKEWKDKYQERAFKRQVGANKAIDRLAKEEVELDEALRHEIAGQVGRFIGNKIDPVHGDIMHAHGKEAYRQAAYHIRKTISDVKDAVSSLHDRLHKQLRTGGLATEEVDLDEAKYPGFRVRMTPGVSKLPRRGYGYVPQGDQDPRTGLPLGFSPAKDTPKETDPKKTKNEAMEVGGKLKRINKIRKAMRSARS